MTPNKLLSAWTVTQTELYALLALSLSWRLWEEYLKTCTDISLIQTLTVLRLSSSSSEELLPSFSSKVRPLSCSLWEGFLALGSVWLLRKFRKRKGIENKNHDIFPPNWGPEEINYFPNKTIRLYWVVNIVTSQKSDERKITKKWISQSPNSVWVFILRHFNSIAW
jgi:hypothetical protein